MRKDIPSLGMLQAFETSARCLSFSRAADELLLTPSAVSRHVAALEQRLGVALFVRHRKRLTLTDAGSSYAARVRQRLDELERDTQEIRVGQEQGFVLRLAVVPTFCTEWLIPRLPDFAARHPDITIHLAARTEAFAFEQSGFDAAIYHGDRLWPQTQGEMILPEGDSIALAAPALLAAHDLHTPAGWLGCPHLTLISRATAWADWYASQGWHYTLHASRGPRHELFSMQLAAASAGLGVCLVPRLLAQTHLAVGTLVQAHPHGLPGRDGYWFVSPPRRSLPAPLQTFQRWLQQQSQRTDSPGFSAQPTPAAPPAPQTPMPPHG
ncbi:LysR substrate-binding domain-containing protein [Ottowia testudinis]|uniref:LysR family transcriptional regulator n=1 Tax=Ottowia testudinis TaxID=2816950 RepID=A0A975H2I3_9BURK|nr:LysR substrate-binding domain-containing protein [Ottowia testudinis]QTD44824.1 LysR family transcriptional regulator [Ottowia testudinis]